MKESLNNFDFNLVNNELSTTAISFRDEFHAVEKLGQSRKQRTVSWFAVLEFQSGSIVFRKLCLNLW